MWKGGRHLDKHGYVMVFQPGHPYASKTGKGRAGYVREHRLVMEAVLGRYLTPQEVVHHKDGNNQNNTPSNLELFTKNSDHLATTLKGKIPRWTEDGKRRIAEGQKKKIGMKLSPEARKNMSLAQYRRHGKIPPQV